MCQGSIQLTGKQTAQKVEREKKASGIETDMSELELAVEDLIEREEEVDAQHKENQELNNKKKEDCGLDE